MEMALGRIGLALSFTLHIHTFSSATIHDHRFKMKMEIAIRSAEEQVSNSITLHAADVCHACNGSHTLSILIQGALIAIDMSQFSCCFCKNGHTLMLLENLIRYDVLLGV